MLKYLGGKDMSAIYSGGLGVKKNMWKHRAGGIKQIGQHASAG